MKSSENDVILRLKTTISVLKVKRKVVMDIVSGLDLRTSILMSKLVF